MDAPHWELAAAYDLLLKYIVVGESGTGKSCLVHRFCDGECASRLTDKGNTGQTIGVEFASRVLDVSGKLVKLQLWDTAGQERFRSVTRSYYRGSAVALLVYDISNRASFEAAGSWLGDARTLGSPHLVGVLVGNKLDRDDEREVDYIEASQWASANGLLFVETSSVTGENVELPFVLSAQAVLLAIDNGTIFPESPESGISYGDRTLSQSHSGLLDPDLSRSSGLHVRGRVKRCCA
ncbi:hypothetical protein MCUN1_001012 [Malassezia cuniculi]|uniref:Ras-related protein Rab-4B n=1 Tax=Malassezia cuniculi TaxID=948313 RepID=A0AAF0ES31_9BASI|nr:hypothetical protein MCUN1_001012 [Malassezia cuniculi]